LSGKLAATVCHVPANRKASSTIGRRARRLNEAIAIKLEELGMPVS
jgi:hypothetical protein